MQPVCWIIAVFCKTKILRSSLSWRVNASKVDFRGSSTRDSQAHDWRSSSKDSFRVWSSFWLPRKKTVVDQVLKDWFSFAWRARRNLSFSSYVPCFVQDIASHEVLQVLTYGDLPSSLPTLCSKKKRRLCPNSEGPGTSFLPREEEQASLENFRISRKKKDMIFSETCIFSDIHLLFEKSFGTYAQLAPHGGLPTLIHYVHIEPNVLKHET